MQQLIAIGTVLYGLFMLVVPIIVIIQLSNMRNEFQALNQNQSRVIEQLDLLIQGQANLRSAFAASVPIGRLDPSPRHAEPIGIAVEPGPPSDEAHALAALFSDPQVVEQAREVGRIYGAWVRVSFLKRRASELGMGDIDFTETGVAAALKDRV